MVIEVVGLSKALRIEFDILRPWGVLSSIGVHNEEVRRRSAYSLGLLTAIRSHRPEMKLMGRI